MEFIKNNIIYIAIISLILVIATAVVLVFTVYNTGDNHENRDKALLSNLVVNAISYGDIETANQYYNNLVTDGVITENIKDEYFDFDQPHINSMWGRFDAGGKKEVSIILNTKLNEGVNEDNVYLTVVSYSYPVVREDLGHNVSNVSGGEEIYYRNNTVVVSQVNDGKVTMFKVIPEQSFVTESTEVGTSDLEIFQEQLEPIDLGEYLDDLQHNH